MSRVLACFLIAMTMPRADAIQLSIFLIPMDIIRCYPVVMFHVWANHLPNSSRCPTAIFTFAHSNRRRILVLTFSNHLLPFIFPPYLLCHDCDRCTTFHFLPSISHAEFSAYKREAFLPSTNRLKSKWNCSTHFYKASRRLYRAPILLWYLIFHSLTSKRFVTSSFLPIQTKFVQQCFICWIPNKGNHPRAPFRVNGAKKNHGQPKS